MRRPVKQGRLRVYQAGLLWYLECPQCKDGDGDNRRWVSPWWPYTYGMSRSHIAAHTEIVPAKRADDVEMYRHIAFPSSHKEATDA